MAAVLAVQGLAAETWTTRRRDGRVEALRDGKVAVAWQAEALVDPAGGDKFKASAFLHPLRTPSGFDLTTIQPSDHLHHFGVWWPWKFIETGGGKFNCWEIQQGEGGLVARGVKQVPGGPDAVEWEFANEVVVMPDGGAPEPAIAQKARVRVSSIKGANVVDITLDEKASGGPVTVSNYRYSGFSWRGTPEWNKDNSTMLTSGGRHRDNANHTPARWVMVSGKAGTGEATMLIMSAAEKLAGTPEKLRVWGSKAENGAPFINLNPVVDEALPLDDAHPAVSKRKYRLIAADGKITADQANAFWNAWVKE